MAALLSFCSNAYAATMVSSNYQNAMGSTSSGGSNATSPAYIKTGIVIGQGVFVPSNGSSSPGYRITPLALASRITLLHNGDINGDGVVDIADALLSLKAGVGLTHLSAVQLVRGDVGPLINNVPIGDGKIDIEDSILILRKAVGLGW
jgi:hypothetical protein